MPAANDIWAIILAAGSGTRMQAATGGTRKQFLTLDGYPLYWRSARTFAAIPRVKGVVFVFPGEEFEDRKTEVATLDQAEPLGLPWRVAPGGARRQDSVRHGLGELPKECGCVLVHDSARPFASPQLTLRVIDAVEQGALGSVPAIAVTDTVKRVDGGEAVQETLNRSELRAVQTPQGFDRAALDTAHERALAEGWEVTDDASMVERIGKVVCVDGEEGNVKITTPADLQRLVPQSIPLPVTGFGYDVHAFHDGRSSKPARPLMLGGVTVQGGPQIIAHSDGDVLLHALVDAILGCCAGGDIGQHFPDNDPAWDGAASSVFVTEAVDLARRRGVQIVNADLTIITQVPKIAPHKERIRKNIERLLELESGRVNVSATTEEKLGFTGKKQGIKAVACVSALRSQTQGETK